MRDAAEARDTAVAAMESTLARMVWAASGKIGQRSSTQLPLLRSGTPNIGELEADIEEFLEQISINPLTYDEVRLRPFFEGRLESVISGAAHIADSHCTREDHRTQIVDECNILRQLLQDLLREYAQSNSSGQLSEMIPKCMDNLIQKMSSLRIFLRRAVTDNVSDCFVDPAAPLLALLSAAQQGDTTGVDRYISMYQEHVDQMMSVSRMSCAISSDEVAIRAVQIASGQIQDMSLLMPMIARMFALRSASAHTLNCADRFKSAWLDAVIVLMGGVDGLTAVDDFFGISEDHILEDVNKCVAFLQQGDAASFEQSVALVRARVLRLCQRLNAYADSLPAEESLADRLRTSANQLNDVALPAFLQIAGAARKGLLSGQLDQLDENALVDSARQLYEYSADACRILSPPTHHAFGTEERVTSGSVIDVGTFEPRNSSRTSGRYSVITDQEDMVKEIKLQSSIPSEREQMVMAWSAEQREQIREQIEFFRQERMKFNKEVGKWDEAGNELIQLSKQMCAIMMEMTDFTRNRGPLRTVMDVINAARRISDLGNRLDKLARSVGDQCPDSITKKDLFAYLQRITLHCHQLSICSKVKADVENISGELAAHHSLESATSLIQAARNLMEAVVLTVKSCYVASTKYSRLTGNRPVIQWRMKPPTKKPVVQNFSSSQLNESQNLKYQQQNQRNGLGPNILQTHHAHPGSVQVLPPVPPPRSTRMKSVDAFTEFES